MMKIRNAQMERFERTMLERQAPELLQFVRQVLPAVVEQLGDATCLELLRNLMADAYEQGFQSLDDVQTPALLALRWGDLRAVPWIAEVYLDTRVPVSVRLAELRRREDEILLGAVAEDEGD